MSHYENSNKTSLLSFFLKKKSIPRVKMVKRSDKTNTGEGVKGKKSRTVSDDSCGKSLSDKVKDERRTKNNNLEFLSTVIFFFDFKNMSGKRTSTNSGGNNSLIQKIHKQ